MKLSRARLEVPDGVDPVMVTGAGDEALRALQDRFPGTRVVARGGTVSVSGADEDVQALTSVLSELVRSAPRGEAPTARTVDALVDLVRTDAYSPAALHGDVVLRTARGKAVRPRTAGQKRLVDAVRANQITFALGPAGSGKTYLAMAMALAALDRGDVARLVLSRPVVEAGESLGFLPGTLQDKVDPYVRPMHDALREMLGPVRAKELAESGSVEVAPLAFMRGRTLGDSFVILDEAQNVTPDQMRMFLTRLGEGGRFIVTGDVSQSDLPGGATGLREARCVLDGIEGIAFVDLDVTDVVRHTLVAKIVAAYARAEQEAAQRRERPSSSADPGPRPARGPGPDRGPETPASDSQRGSVR